MCSHGFVSSLPRVGCSKAKCDDLGSCNCNEAWEVVRLVKKGAKEERAAKIVTRGRRVPTRQPKDGGKIRRYGMLIWNVVADGHRVGGCAN